MILFCFIAKILAVSTTDCFPTSPEFWFLNGNYSTDKNSIFFEPENENSTFISYTSNRFRKKWMVSVCGTMEDSLIEFKNSKPNEKQEKQEKNNTQIFIRHESAYLRVELKRDNEVVKTTKVTKANKLNQYCFNIISGRGYLGMFGMNNNKDKEGEQLFVTELEIPRFHTFSYIARKQSNISRICVGDFFGNDRVSFRPDNEKWEQHVKDFL